MQGAGAAEKVPLPGGVRGGFRSKSRRQKAEKDEEGGIQVTVASLLFKRRQILRASSTCRMTSVCDSKI